MKKYGFGVDIGGTTCKIGLFEMNGTLIEDWEIKTNTENKGASILDDVAAAIEGKMQSAGIAKEEVQGIGVGVPGPVTGDGTVLQCVNLGWGEFNVAEVLKKRTGFDVKVGNDANVAALGEMWQGGGKGHKDVVMVTLGTGVGGGIIVDGKIVAGANGAGGEIGHIMVNEEETDTCGCGKKGCLEQYASATGIVRMAKKLLASDDRETTLKNVSELTAKDIFDAAKAGDAVAKELVEKLGKVLGNALANVACVVNPEIIVIGGGVSKAGNVLLDYIQKYFQKYAFKGCRGALFTLATLGNDAGIYGAARLVLK
jgi:ROK family protein